MEGESRLVRLCIEEACRSREAVAKWRKQRRSVERLPPHLANELLQSLLHRRLLFPSLLEVFKHNVEEINLRGENSVDAEWMAYLGAFRYLRNLNLADCHKINNSALWAITGMTSVKELDLSRCSKVSDAAVRHLLSIPTVEKLWISETGVTANGVALLSSLKNLSLLDLGGLPVTDAALNSLQVLQKLQHLDLWGSKITDKSATTLNKFPKLSFLNLAWTDVTEVPNMSSLGCLNLSNCTINYILKGDGNKAPLRKLILSGVNFLNDADAFLYVETSLLIFLDVSKSSLQKFYFLPHMKMLEHLNLGSTLIGDDSVELVACMGSNLKNLNLNGTRVSSVGIDILAGHVPNLEILSLSHTLVDDAAISIITVMMPLIKDIDLSHTEVKGFIQQAGNESEVVSSLTPLQNLCHLERLNLEETQVSDEALHPLSTFNKLSHLYLKSASLTDDSLSRLSALTKLTNLSIQDAILTNYGLDSLEPQAGLKILDLRGCWLLTIDAISLLCKKYPHIEIRHEHVQDLISDRSSPSPASSTRTSLKMKQVNTKQEPLPMPQCFIDQRLKYGTEELLSLRYSSLSLVSPNDRGIVIPKMESD